MLIRGDSGFQGVGLPSRKTKFYESGLTKRTKFVKYPQRNNLRSTNSNEWSNTIMYGFINRAETQRETGKPAAACVRTEGAVQAAAHKDIMGWCGVQEPRNPANSALMRT